MVNGTQDNTNATQDNTNATQDNIESIFGEAGDVELTQTQEKAIVGFLIAFVFLLMAFEVVDPDVAFFGALVVCLFTGILNMVNTASPLFL
jgi:hypothetical protein